MVTAGGAVPVLVGARGRTTTWAFGPGVDLVLAAGWVPVFLCWHLLASGTSSAAAAHAQQGVALALLVSFLHQPLTFGLVYGDGAQFSLHRRLFCAAPVLALAVAVPAAVFGWWIVVPVAAVWNLQHTLQQRYGVLRIYAGRSRYGSARLDRAAVYVPMTAVLLAVAAMPALTSLVARSGLDARNAGGVKLLTLLRPTATALLAVAVVATVVVAVLVVRQERRAGTASNPAKWGYQAGQCALLAAIVVDPVAGFVAYVAAHAVEYALVVDRTASRRYGLGRHPGPDGGDGRRSILGVAARRPAGRVAFFASIAGAALLVRMTTGGTALDAVVYAVGALHFTYDAVIWKLRKPALAHDLGLSAAPAGATA